MLAHLSMAESAVLVSILQLVSWAMSSRKRWRRFVFFIILLLAVRAGWWALADNGMQALLHDFGQSIPRSGSRAG